MEITAEHILDPVPVTILKTHGDLDASNYQDLIEAVRQVYQAGARDILLDMSGTPFMSSAGIVSLHASALLLRGEQPTDPESGWEAIHAIDRDLDKGYQEHFKLLNPQPRVDRALEKSGLKRFFEIYTDREEALASFRNAPRAEQQG